MGEMFILGVLIGVFSNLIPDAFSARQIWTEQPQYRPHLACLIVGIASISIIVATEVKRND